MRGELQITGSLCKVKYQLTAANLRFTLISHSETTYISEYEILLADVAILCTYDFATSAVACQEICKIVSYDIKFLNVQ